MGRRTGTLNTEGVTVKLTQRIVSTAERVVLTTEVQGREFNSHSGSSAVDLRNVRDGEEMEECWKRGKCCEQKY